LHAQAALQLGDQLAVRRADLLVHVDAFAMLVDAIGQLARAPMLGLFDLAAFFLAGVLDHAKDLLDLVLRRCRPDDENQVVVTLFHMDLFPLNRFAAAASVPRHAAQRILLPRLRTAGAIPPGSSPQRPTAR